MKHRMALSVAALMLLSMPAYAADCDKDFSDLAKAISGPVTFPEGHRAAMVRKALHGYDECMAGDPKHLAGIRDVIMKQISENLGGNR